MPPAKFSPTGDSPIPVFPVASAACSGLGWQDLLLRWVGTHSPGRSPRFPAPCTQSTPHRQGERERKQCPPWPLQSVSEETPAESGTQSSPNSCLLMAPPTHCSHTP